MAERFSFLSPAPRPSAGAINDLHKTGRIFANDGEGLCSCTTDEFGQLAGASIKSANPTRISLNALAIKPALWFHVGPNTLRSKHNCHHGKPGRRHFLPHATSQRGTVRHFGFRAIYPR